MTTPIPVALPVVSFFNTALSQRCVLVCLTLEEAKAQEARLFEKAHITEVELTWAAVKGG